MSKTMLGKADRSPYRMLQSVLNWLISSTGRAFVVIFILAFGIRVHSLTKYPVEYLIPNTERELGAIAKSIVANGQFADPYALATGPTAHLPPVPPAILALVYSLFGRTKMAGYVFMGFIMMTNSIMYAMLPWVGDKFGTGKKAGFIAGMAGAFMLELEWSTHGEGLAGILLGIMLVGFLARWNKEQNSLLVSLLLGLGIGASFHVQPALLLVFLGCLFFEIVWFKGKGKQALTGMLAVGVLLACVPWAVRNYVVFHEFFFIRSNLGLELRMGSHEGATAAMESMSWDKTKMGAHPRLSYVEALRLKELGEMEYMRQAMREALSWMAANPGEFLKLTFLRFILFWFGPLYSWAPPYSALLTILAFFSLKDVVPALTVPRRVVILVPLITFPLIYYLVPYMPRYRIPIDWMILLLAGAEVWHLIKTGSQDHSHG
jgi:hypothetical protein